MSKISRICSVFFTACIAVVLFVSIHAFASDDNSLYSLGILTEGAEVTPEFSYDHWEYDVSVPAGTKKIELDPVTSSESAKIVEIRGTELGEDGTAAVYITVEAQSGAQFTYSLNVTADAAPIAQTEPPTEAPTEKVTEKITEKPKETEPVTEDTTYVKVPRDTVDQAERTIKDLQGEITVYRDTTNLYTKIIFGLIAACVVLLFLVINLILRKRDLKNEVKEYRSLGYVSSKQKKKAAARAQKAAGKNAAPADAPGTRAPYEGGGYPTQPGAPYPDYTGRQNPYYEKAPLDVTPQTSSRNMQTQPGPAEDWRKAQTKQFNSANRQGAPTAGSGQAVQAQPSGAESGQAAQPRQAETGSGQDTPTAQAGAESRPEAQQTAGPGKEQDVLTAQADLKQERKPAPQDLSDQILQNGQVEQVSLEAQKKQANAADRQRSGRKGKKNIEINMVDL